MYMSKSVTPRTQDSMPMKEAYCPVYCNYSHDACTPNFSENNNNKKHFQRLLSWSDSGADVANIQDVMKNVLAKLQIAIPFILNTAQLDIILMSSYSVILIKWIIHEIAEGTRAILYQLWQTGVEYDLLIGQTTTLMKLKGLILSLFHRCYKIPTTVLGCSIFFKSTFFKLHNETKSLQSDLNIKPKKENRYEKQ